MKSLRITNVLSVIAIIAALGFPAVVWASPADAPSAQTNLLSNGSFESFSGGTATGWAVWSLPGDGCGRTTPTAQQATTTIDARRVKDGSSAQQLLASSTDPGKSFFGGLQQTVSVTAGKTYRFTVYAQMWSSTGDNPLVSENAQSANFKIGIGQGATYAADPNIKLSDLVDSKDSYRQLTLDAVATGSQITVFTYANPASCNKHTEVFFDAATLTEVGASAPAATSAPAVPTATPLIIPTNFPTPTANAEGKIIYIVQPGDSIIHIGAVIGRGSDFQCIADIKQMNGLSGNTLSVGQQLIIGTASGAAAQPTATTAPTLAPTTAPTQPGAVAPTADPNVTGTAPLPTTEGQPAPTQTTTGGGAGSICVTLYNDANGNGVLDPGEGLVAGGNFALLDLGASITLATYATDGASEPYCFENLASGNYRVTSTAPEGYKATTRSDWDLTLAAGSTANLEFGAQSTGGTTGGGEAARATDNSRLVRALLAAVGVVLLLVAAGVAGFLVLTRRR